MDRGSKIGSVLGSFIRFKADQDILGNKRNSKEKSKYKGLGDLKIVSSYPISFNIEKP